MELRQVRSFLMLNAEGTFRRASEKLHIVQPALTQQIQALEEELGCDLFVRSSRGVQLTTAGKAFLVEAQEIILHTERAREATLRVTRGQTGTVRIGFAATAAISGRLPCDLERFHHLYPDVHLEIQEMCATQQAIAIEEDRLDVGYGRIEPDLPAFVLRADVLAEWSWVVALSANHALAARSILEIGDLQAQPFVVFGQSGEKAGQLSTLRQMLSSEPTYMYQMNAALSVLSLVGAGVGVALAPEPMAQLQLPNVVFRPLTGYAGTTTLALVSRVEESQPTVCNFRRTVLENHRLVTADTTEALL